MAEVIKGKSYLLAVDHSPNSQYAFEEIPFYGPAMSAVVITEVQKSAELRAEHLLGEYVQRCRLAGIKNYKSLLGRGGHVGEVICRAVEEKEADFLVIGRRGMGKIKRIFIGSTSRYCVEHANCTVVCVKMPPNHQPTPLPSTVPYQEPVPTHKAEVHEQKTTKVYPSQGVTTNHELFTIQED